MRNFRADPLVRFLDISRVMTRNCGFAAFASSSPGVRICFRYLCPILKVLTPKTYSSHLANTLFRAKNHLNDRQVADVQFRYPSKVSLSFMEILSNMVFGDFGQEKVSTKLVAQSNNKIKDVNGTVCRDN